MTKPLQTRRIGYWPGRKGRWHRWFAWYPVRLGKIGRLVWLRRVRRRFVTTYGCDGLWLTQSYYFEYRK